jgi:hypothetical protein
MREWIDDLVYHYGELVILAVVIAVFAGGLFWLHAATAETPEQRAAAYSAWCKLSGRTDITLDEWRVLRANYLLPGMDGKRAAEASEAASFAAGVAAGAAASR